MEHLPQEIIFIILDFLPCNVGALLKMRLVSKSFLEKIQKSNFQVDANAKKNIAFDISEQEDIWKLATKAKFFAEDGPFLSRDLAFREKTQEIFDHYGSSSSAFTWSQLFYVFFFGKCL